MNDWVEAHVGRVTELFVSLGASVEQAETMARQLLKRAGQLAHEQGISKLEATEALLKKVVEARRNG
jgi:5,10-methenyltetrahydromethanopterin hydrogenase